MKSFTLEKPPLQPEPLMLTAAARKSLWTRVGVSVLCVGFTIALSLLLVRVVNYNAFFVFIVGLALSLIVPYWHFSQQAYLRPRLGLSAFYFGLTLFAVVLQMVVLNGPSYFLIFSLFTGLALSLVLPHFRYREGLYSFLILVAWFVLISVAMPPLAKQYYLSTAAQLVPRYPALQFINSGYSPGSFPDQERSVGYTYQTSSNPKEDYIKIVDYYKNELGKKEWSVLKDAENHPLEYDYGDHAYVTFGKVGNDSTRISIYLDNLTTHEIYVVASF